MHYFIDCITKTFDFSGRSRRKEYWLFILFYYLFYFLSFILDGLLGLNFTNSEVGFVTLSYVLLMLIPSLSVLVRRLHDTNRSGFMSFIIFIPFIGAIYLIIVTLIAGDIGRNKYGNDPKEP